MSIAYFGLAFALMLLSEPRRAWGSFAINTLYWIGIAEGAMVLACAIRLSNGRWAGPMLRIVGPTGTSDGLKNISTSREILSKTGFPLESTGKTLGNCSMNIRLR